MTGLDVYLDPADGKPKKWTPPSNPPSDDYLARLECCKHGVDDGACKECYDDTALLRQALEALENSVDLVQHEYRENWRHGVPTRERQLNGLKELMDAHEAAIAALKERLK